MGSSDSRLEKASQYRKSVNPIGYRYTSGDGKYIAQFKVDGFTLSRMEPYTVWEDVRSEAAKLWEIYHRVANVETITRLATRYTNVIRVPMDAPKEFGEYLTCPPEVPKDLPQAVSSFLSRIVFHDPDIRSAMYLNPSTRGCGH